MTEKQRVVVLMGGDTNEREISLESGRNITYKIPTEKYVVLPVFVSSQRKLYHMTPRMLVHNSTKEIEDTLADAQEIKWHDLPTIADFVFLGLHGGIGENGCVQGALELLGLPYNGSGVLASALCMNKYKTCSTLKAHGFDVPQAELISRVAWEQHKEATLKKITDTFTLPIIIKPHDDGCSMMVQKINNTKDIAGGLGHLFARDKEYALVEECITGMELTVGVVGNETVQALPPSQAVCAADILSIEEKFLPGAGENQTPAPLPATALQFVQKTIADAYRALGCSGYARIDCFYQPEAKRVVIIEVNSLPAMTPATCLFHQAGEIGMRPTEFVDLIIQLGFEKHGKGTAPMPIVGGKEISEKRP